MVYFYNSLYLPFLTLCTVVNYFFLLLLLKCGFQQNAATFYFLHFHFFNAISSNFNLTTDLKHLNDLNVSHFLSVKNTECVQVAASQM